MTKPCMKYEVRNTEDKVLFESNNFESAEYQAIAIKKEYIETSIVSIKENDSEDYEPY